MVTYKIVNDSPKTCGQIKVLFKNGQKPHEKFEYRRHILQDRGTYSGAMWDKANVKLVLCDPPPLHTITLAEWQSKKSGPL